MPTPTQLLHYRLLDKLGEGGMGVVYKAVDTHLDRTVALKLLPPEKIADGERKRRFVQEAKSASALNHPNIVTIHDINSDRGVDFMVMEFIDGKTLDQLSPRHGMRSPELLHIAVQIAEGMEAAHGAGITHRDLKPSNIMVSSAGHVKILDFGLAKLTDPSDTTEADRTLTARLPLTSEGAILGTVCYMSPEQAEGKKIDGRSDIFSFGAVLYEMASGHRAFHGDTPASTLGAVIHKDPKPLAELVPVVPRELDRLIARCLRKDRSRRYQGMADLKVALLDLKEETDSGRLSPSGAAASRSTKPASSRWPWAVAAVGLLAGAAVGITGWYRRQPPPASPYRLRQITADTGLTTTPAISPDGRLIAYASDRATGRNLDIWVHPLTDNAQPIRITTNDADDRDPAFSADGGQIAFYSRREGGGIYVVPALGGQERLLVRGAGKPRYSPDGSWLAYATHTNNTLENSQVFVVPAGGGPPRQIGAEVGWAGHPIWSPDSRSIVFSGMKAVGDMNSVSLWRAPVEGGAATRLSVSQVSRTSARSADDWPQNGLLIARTGRLVEEDPARPGSSSTLFTATGRVEGARAAAGKVVFAALPTGRPQQLWSVAIDHNSGRIRGAVEPLLQASGSDSQPAISVDGSKLLFTHQEPTRSELRLRDMAAGKETVLRGDFTRGKISPDGTKVAFSDFESVSTMDASGGEITKLAEGPATNLYGWTQDGGSLVYYHGGPIRWFTLNLANGKSSALPVHPKFTIHGVEFSPDKNWIAFHIPGGVRAPVFISAVREGNVAIESEWIRAADTVGNNGRPWWSPDGGLLYWVSERDGFACVWAQRLEPATKKPKGESFAVLHFHEARRSLLGYGLAGFGPAVSRDRLTFALPEFSGNIWLAEKEVGAK